MAAVMVTVACLRSEAGETTCDVPVVNPTPHEVVMLPEEGTVDISAGVRLMDKSGLFREAAGRLPVFCPQVIRKRSVLRLISGRKRLSGQESGRSPALTVLR